MGAYAEYNAVEDPGYELIITTKGDSTLILGMNSTLNASSWKCMCPVEIECINLMIHS
jgi:hypothetical protein